jgi:hypothetical protein
MIVVLAKFLTSYLMMNRGTRERIQYIKIENFYNIEIF